jgi:hypothetical protein
MGTYTPEISHCIGEERKVATATGKEAAKENSAEANTRSMETKH